MEDHELVSDFLNSRSERAFRNLYQAKTPYLYQMALRLTQDADTSQDLVQQMWVIAIRKLGEFEWRSGLKTWLTAILINLYRNQRREQERLVELHHMTEQPSIHTNVSVMDLEAAIALLPPGYRQVIILHDIEGYKHKEIADIMDISEGTSKSQLFRARNAIRQYLNDESV